MADPLRLRDHPWQLSYSTSSHAIGGRPVDILHQFYIPALSRATGYDRVAGYFRSSSLAVASQGFSAFVAHGGVARMVVGADLDADDVAAILAGDEARLTAGLAGALEQSEQWPEAEQRGVALLAWMVARGRLEVRVALRVHGQTGDPLASESAVDGYVHEKWAVFRDAAGDRLYASGSFNESKTALVRNAENIDVHRDWTGEENRQRTDDAEARFQRTWNNQNPSLQVLSLPEAVRQRLIKLAGTTDRPLEIDGTSAIPLPVPAPSAMERLRFALLRDGPLLPNGEYVGMVTAPLEPWPHQTVVARRLIDTWPYSWLLCDEVGLGKTIEAGLAIRGLYLSGLVRRVLIAPPASVAGQWQRELATKFLLPFARALTGTPPRHEYLLPVRQDRTAKSLYEPNLTIVSSGLLARVGRRAELDAAEPFDIALVDEAHYARRQNAPLGTRAEPHYGNLYRTLSEVLRGKTRCLLLATATPMQLDPVEVADLIRLTRRVGHFQLDPSLSNAYYTLLGKLVGAEPLDDTQWAFLHRAVTAVARQDPLLWAYVQRAVIDDFARFDVDTWIESGQPPMGGEEGILRLAFAVAPLSRVMLRHTRPLLEIYRSRGQLTANLARRVVLPLKPISFTTQEQQAYDRLEAYCVGLTGQLGTGKQGGSQGKKSSFALGMMLSFLRLRFASSLFAIRESLRRRREKVAATLQHLVQIEEIDLDELSLSDLLEGGEGDEEAVALLLVDRTADDLIWERERLGEMLADLRDLSGTSSKMQRLLEHLNKRRGTGGRIEQTVVFTRFYDTLTDIVARLRQADPQMLIGTYSGQGGSYVNPLTWRLTGIDREMIKHRFQNGEIDVLICTDAAAEGLNLQTADLLVNFDLPWNPMKVEQRIGRIDRIGQTHKTICVSNLCYLGSAEEIVYGRLLARLSKAGGVVGTQQIAMLPVTAEEFQELAARTLSEDELAKRTQERAVLAQRRTASMEIPPEDLYETYLRLAQGGTDSAPPIDLEAIWQTLSNSTYLRDLGCTLHPDPVLRCIVLNNVPGIPSGKVLTVSPKAYNEGIPGLEGTPGFATYGDPTFETLLAQLGSFDLPACVRRLDVEIAGTDARLVGYVVRDNLPVGQDPIRLVRGWRDLGGLALDETQAVEEVSADKVLGQLKALARLRSERLKGVGKIEVLNEQSGRGQLVLAYLVAHRLMQARRTGGSGTDRFWHELTSMENTFADRDLIRVKHIPVKTVRQFPGGLFETTLPNIGEEGYVDAPHILRECAFDAAARIADGLPVKRDDLSTDDMIARLERAISKVISGK
jgi:hypothetical protein